MSIFEQLHVKYKSRERDETSSEIKTTVVYMGSREICEQALDSDFKVGQSYQDLGTLENVKFSQDEGPIWNLTCSYSISLNSGTHAKGTKAGPDDSALEIRMLGLPLEVHANYRKHWNYNLYTTNIEAPTTHIPSPEYMNTWMNATALDDAIPASQVFDPNADADELKSHTYLAWGKHFTDCPTLPTGATWFELKKMTKPGVEYFNYPVYELTEMTSNRSRKEAAWTAAQRAGKVIKPINGDFDITKRFGGNWLCEGATVKYNGKYWVASLTYTHSPDTQKNAATPLIDGSEQSGYGWDQEIYCYQSRAAMNPYNIWNDPAPHGPDVKPWEPPTPHTGGN